MLSLFPHEDAARAREIYQRLNDPAQPREKTTVELYAGQPFRVLLAGMLSARTREEDTLTAMKRLLALADSPQTMKDLPVGNILKAIDCVTYPGNKAQYVRQLCEKLTEAGGEVPRTVEELVQYPGVGWKVAVLTLWLAYGLAPEICVDVHVGRIGKRLGMVNPQTEDPQKISRELMQIIPRELWGGWNPTIVAHGRATCYPEKPACSRCPLSDLCPKVGV